MLEVRVINLHQRLWRRRAGWRTRRGEKPKQDRGGAWSAQTRARTPTRQAERRRSRCAVLSGASRPQEAKTRMD